MSKEDSFHLFQTYESYINNILNSENNFGNVNNNNYTNTKLKSLKTSKNSIRDTSKEIRNWDKDTLIGIYDNKQLKTILNKCKKSRLSNIYIFVDSDGDVPKDINFVLKDAIKYPLLIIQIPVDGNDNYVNKEAIDSLFYISIDKIKITSSDNSTQIICVKRDNAVKNEANLLIKTLSNENDIEEEIITFQAGIGDKRSCLDLLFKFKTTSININLLDIGKNIWYTLLSMKIFIMSGPMTKDINICSRDRRESGILRIENGDVQFVLTRNSSPITTKLATQNSENTFSSIDLNNPKKYNIYESERLCGSFSKSKITKIGYTYFIFGNITDNKYSLIRLVLEEEYPLKKLTNASILMNVLNSRNETKLLEIYFCYQED